MLENHSEFVELRKRVQSLERAVVTIVLLGLFVVIGVSTAFVLTI